MKKFLALALSLLMLLTFVACKPARSSSDANTSAADESTAETPATPGTTEIAIILKTLSSPFWQSMKSGIEEKAKELGVQVDVFAANSEDDVEGQVALLENCISKGYKAIGVAPLSPENLNNAIADATKKGIYVINVDEQVNVDALTELGGAISHFVTTDNVAVGKLAGDYIVGQISDGGKVAIIEGKAGNVSGEDRKNGCKQVFEATNGIELVESQPADWDRTKAYDIAANYITKHPDLKAIYCCNDTMAMGALEAVKTAGKDIIVVGTDGNDDAVASVKAGELAATVAQDPAGIGARSTEILVKILQDTPEIVVTKTPEKETVDAQLIKK